jgi:hypothetical protein
MTESEKSITDIAFGLFNEHPNEAKLDDEYPNRHNKEPPIPQIETQFK